MNRYYLARRLSEFNRGEVDRSVVCQRLVIPSELGGRTVQTNQPHAVGLHRREIVRILDSNRHRVAADRVMRQETPVPIVIELVVHRFRLIDHDGRRRIGVGALQ